MTFDFKQITQYTTFLILSIIVLIALVSIFFFYLIIKYRKYRTIKKRRKFLYTPLPCSIDRTLFLCKKSLLDILFDIGLSQKSLDYLCNELGWIHPKGDLNHFYLNEKLSDSVTKYGNYESFVIQTKAHLQGLSQITSPVVQSKSLDITKRLILDPTYAKTYRENYKIDLNMNIHNEAIIEERKVFNSIFINLRDETKTMVAKRLGITHRFDYLTTEAFRVVGESDKRHLVSSLDPDKYLGADLLQAFGALSATGGMALLGIDALLDATIANGVATAGDASGDLGDLGELVLIVGAVFYTAGLLKKISRSIRERKLTKYRNEFKMHMEALSDQFFSQGEEQALRVPRLVIQALEIEKTRLEQLNTSLLSTLSKRKTNQNISSLYFDATKEAIRINDKMLEKFSKEINNLLRNVKKYVQNGRKDLAGVHLYINKEISFLPSQLPEQKLNEVNQSQIQLLQEIIRLNKGK